MFHMLQHISEHGCHQLWGVRFGDNSSKSLLLIILYSFRLTLIMYTISWHTPQCRTRSSVWKGSLIIYYVRMTKPRVSQGSNTFFLLIFHTQQVIQWMWLCIISCIIVHSQWQQRRKWCELNIQFESRRWLCPDSWHAAEIVLLPVKVLIHEKWTFYCVQYAQVIGSLKKRLRSSTIGTPDIFTATLSTALGSARC